MKNNLIINSDKTIRQGSKSFSLASRLFDKETFEAAILLYRWCRFCDDEIDRTKPSLQLEKLKFLQEQTEAAIRGDPVALEPFMALRQIVLKYGIPAHYPLELIKGMKMDVENVSYENFDELRLYCYRVAGVVGLMMAHIMGISDERALARACDMGMAMQLTNIARDVFTDAEMGRIYLPRNWLSKFQVPNSSKSFFVTVYHGRLASVTRLLLNEADALYRSGDEGIVFLNRRAQFAILAARYIYSDIGRIVRSRGARAWQSRVYVSLPRKIFWIGVSLAKIIISSIKDIKLPRYQPITITQVWRHQ